MASTANESGLAGIGNNNGYSRNITENMVESTIDADVRHDQNDSSTEALNSAMRRASRGHGSEMAIVFHENKVKRTRGPTTCKEVWTMNPSSKLVIEINDEGQPIGDNANKLSSFLGTLARNGAYAPLNFEDWRLIPHEYKVSMWNLIETKFEMDVVVKEWVMMSLARKWKDFKGKIKDKWYNQGEQDPRVLPDHFTWLRKFWNSRTARDREATGKRNRKKLKYTHTSGSKSFARKRNEMTKKKGKVSRADVFVETHKRFDGTPMDPEAEEDINKMKEAAKLLEAENGTDDWGPDDIYSQVMGKEQKSYVRGYGLGPTQTDLWGNKDTRLVLRQMKSNADKIRDAEMEESKKKLEKLTERVDAICTVLLTKYDNLDYLAVLMSPTQDKEDNQRNGDVVIGEAEPILISDGNNEEETNGECNAEAGQSTVAIDSHILKLMVSLLPTLAHNCQLGSKGTTENRVQNLNDLFGCDLLNQLDATTAAIIEKLQPVLASTQTPSSKPSNCNEIAANLNGSMTLPPDSTEMYSFDEVLVKSFRDVSKTVAKGVIMSKNPEDYVGPQPLGVGWVEVHVEVPILPSEPLLRPYVENTTIGDVVGKPIAWPEGLVVKT